MGDRMVVNVPVVSSHDCMADQEPPLPSITESIGLHTARWEKIQIQNPNCNSY